MRILDKLHALPNPFRRFNRRLTRYMAITFCTGCISFIIALVLLHYGFSPLISLLLSVAASGLAGYAAMELWCFPQRLGRLSWKRFAFSSLVGGLAFLGRYGVLKVSLDLFHSLEPFDKVLALGLAYGASFLIGYTLRSVVVFRRSASVRLGPARTRGETKGA